MYALSTKSIIFCIKCTQIKSNVLQRFELPFAKEKAICSLPAVITIIFV